MWKILFVILGIIYVLWPLDILPDLLAGLGWIDDILVLAAVWWYFFAHRKDRSNAYRKHYDRFQQQQYYRKAESDKEQNYSQSGGPSENQPPRNQKKDPYSILGVDRNASREEIRSAYRRLANKYHPDKVNHMGEEFRELAEKKFKEIQEAYQQLNPK